MGGVCTKYETGSGNETSNLLVIEGFDKCIELVSAQIEVQDEFDSLVGISAMFSVCTLVYMKWVLAMTLLLVLLNWL